MELGSPRSSDDRSIFFKHQDHANYTYVAVKINYLLTCGIKIRKFYPSIHLEYTLKPDKNNEYLNNLGKLSYIEKHKRIIIYIYIQIIQLIVPNPMNKKFCSTFSDTSKLRMYQKLKWYVMCHVILNLKGLVTNYNVHWIGFSNSSTNHRQDGSIYKRFTSSIYWKSERRKTIALSFFEDEYVAASHSSATLGQDLHLVVALYFFFSSHFVTPVTIPCAPCVVEPHTRHVSSDR